MKLREFPESSTVYCKANGGMPLVVEHFHLRGTVEVGNSRN